MTNFPKNSAISAESALSVAVETSGRTGSVALGTGSEIIAKTALSGFPRHSSELFNTINALLEAGGFTPSQIQMIYIPIGPGSFTGIRISVTFAKLLSYAVGAKIAAVSTLEAIACNATLWAKQQHRPPRVAPILDAKRGIFFTALFQWENDNWNRQSEDLLLTPDEFMSRFCQDDKPVALLGEGLQYYSNLFNHKMIKILESGLWSAKAENIYHLGYQKAQHGLFEDRLTLLPKYIRPPDAIPKSGRTG